MSNKIKIVAVGDSEVGKSNLLRCFIQREFQTDYQPTIFDNYALRLPFNNRDYQVHLWDTAGDNSMSNIRRLSYPNTDIFFICFSISEPDSFENITRYWIPELQQNSLKLQIILIGLKKDLRNDQQIIQQLSQRELTPISTEQGIAKAREIGALAYCECSSLTNDNINELLSATTRISIENPVEYINESSIIHKMRNKLGPKFFFQKRKRSESQPNFYVI